MFQSTKQKIISYTVFGIYLVLLIWLVLFKFATNLSELPSMRAVNLIPFYYAQETTMHIKEVLYNVVVFVPMGIYLHLLQENWKTKTKILAVFLSSLLLETVQFIFAIGACDVTDLIANTLGGALGIFFCIILGKCAPKNFVSVINGLGVTGELAVIGLMTLLLVANR